MKVLLLDLFQIDIHANHLFKAVCTVASIKLVPLAFQLLDLSLNRCNLVHFATLGDLKFQKALLGEDLLAYVGQDGATLFVAYLAAIAHGLFGEGFYLWSQREPKLSIHSLNCVSKRWLVPNRDIIKLWHAPVSLR